MKAPIDRSAKLAEMRELEALAPQAPPDLYAPDWYVHVPSGVLVYINALAGEVYCPALIPSRQWLADWLDDAWAATVKDHR